MSSLSRFRYLYAASIPIWLFVTTHTGWPLAEAHLAGLAVDPERVGTLALQALQIPLWMSFLHLARRRPQALRDDLNARVFERSADTVAISAIVLWSYGVGVVIDALLSGPESSVMFGIPHAYFWMGLAMIAISLVTTVISLTPKGTLRLALSSDGILYSKVKRGLIRWEDVGDIRFVNRVGQRQIAIDLSDPAKYALKKRSLMIYPAVFNVDPDAMMEIIEQERTLNLL